MKSKLARVHWAKITQTRAAAATKTVILNAAAVVVTLTAAKVDAAMVVKAIMVADAAMADKIMVADVAMSVKIMVAGVDATMKARFAAKEAVAVLVAVGEVGVLSKARKERLHLPVRPLLRLLSKYSKSLPYLTGFIRLVLDMQPK